MIIGLYKSTYKNLWLIVHTGSSSILIKKISYLISIESDLSLVLCCIVYLVFYFLV